MRFVASRAIDSSISPENLMRQKIVLGNSALSAAKWNFSMLVSASGKVDLSKFESEGFKVAILMIGKGS